MINSRQWALISLAIASAILLYTVFHANGLPRYHQMRQKEAALQEETAALEQQVKQIAKENELLSGGSRSSLSYIEKIARERFRLVGRDDKVLSFPAP